MAFPMLAGTIALNTYNLVDTWFVARLGTIPLAAMGLTFPVVMLLTFIAGGIGTGVTTITSQALGKTDLKTASRTVTHGMILILLFSALLLLSGYLTIGPVFRTLGANQQTLPFVRSYMQMWYLGSLFMAVPMMGNGILISLGDSKAASLFMVTGAVVNCVLDPLLIFGFAGFPALGIFGAALATVIAQAVSAFWLFYLLAVKYKLFQFRHLELTRFVQTVRVILSFAIPGSISMVLMPLSAGIITALISRHGNEAIAAVSAAGRIEMFAFVIPMALGMSLIPFVSQNFGAGRLDRIHAAKNYATRFAFFYGLGIAALFFIASPLLAKIFTSDESVAETLTLYIRIVSSGYGMMEVHRYCGFLLTGIHKPVFATIVNAIRIIVLLIPLSFLGNYYGGIKGIFFGRLIADIGAGITGFIWISLLLKREMRIEPRVAK